MENRTVRWRGNFAGVLCGVAIDKDVRAIIVGVVERLRRDNDIANPF